jgi:hypothetical protein
MGNHFSVFAWLNRKTSLKNDRPGSRSFGPANPETLSLKEKRPPVASFLLAVFI